ncbi:MAG: hypothetical protein ACM36B_18580 [Bacteroidota bacterium]
MKRAWFLSLGLAAGVAGCSTDQVARFVYYTFRVENQAVDQSLPGGQFQSAPIPYERYQQERRGDTSR